MSLRFGLLATMALCAGSHAQTASVEIIPDRQFIVAEISGLRCSPGALKFNMSEVGGARFDVVASTCSSLAPPDILEALRLVGLARHASGQQGRWKLSVTGNARYLSVSTEPAGRCSSAMGMTWLLVRRAGGWRVVEPLMFGVPIVPCLPVQ